MTLSGLTALSSFTDKAPVSPTYMNAKFGEIQANFDTLAATAQSASDVTGSSLSGYGRWHVAAFGDDFQSAISHAYAAGGGTVWCSASSYSVLNLRLLSNVQLDLNGGTLVKDGGAVATVALVASGTTTTPSVLSGVVTSGSTLVPAPIGSLTTGDLVMLADEFFFCTSGASSLAQNLEWNRLAGYSGATLFLAQPARGSYSTTTGAYLAKASGVFNVAVRGGTIRLPSGTSGGGIKFLNVHGGVIENCAIERPFDDPGVAVERSALVRIEGNHFLWGQEIGGSGYGNAVEVNERSQDVVVRGNLVEACSEIAVQTGSRSVLIDGNTDVGAASSAYNTHGNACEDVLIANNIVVNAIGPGIAVGQTNTLYPDQRVVVEGNHLYNCGVNGINVTGSAGSEVRDVVVRGNTIHRFGAVATGRGISVSRATNVTVQDNTIHGWSGNAAAMILVSAATNIRIARNSMWSGPNTYGVQITNGTGACDSVRVEGNLIEGVSSSNIRMDGATHTNVWILDNRSDDNALTITSGATLSGNIWGAMRDASIASDGLAISPSYAFQSELSLGFYRSGVSTIAPSYGTLNLATNAVRFSTRTLAASAITTSAANTNVAVNEMVFTVGGASGASLAIHSGGTVYIFNSAISAKAT